jgi:ribosome biogenesis GTPase A
VSVQWFPGHMHATRKAIADRAKDIDVVIEMLDARLPGSSANPMLAELTAGIPTLKVLNKQDLADPLRTALWLAHYNARPGTRALALDASVKAPAKALIAACFELAPQRGGMVKPMRVLIGGIPNVGKSTLINTLVDKRATKTGDEAGITKTEQRIVLADDFYLYDTPGVLWPKITVPQSGYCLAASGAVGRNAYDEEEVALELLKLLQQPYAAALEARYKWGWKLEDIAAKKDEELLMAVGRKRGALLPGGRLNHQKAAESVLNDFRMGALGRITLESPDDFARWWAAGQAAENALVQARQAKLQARKPSSSRRKAPGAHD